MYSLSFPWLGRMCFNPLLLLLTCCPFGYYCLPHAHFLVGFSPKSFDSFCPHKSVAIIHFLSARSSTKSMYAWILLIIALSASIETRGYKCNDMFGSGFLPKTEASECASISPILASSSSSALCAFLSCNTNARSKLK